jgi:hypothetical protein
MSTDYFGSHGLEENGRSTMDELGRVLETCLPFVIINLVWNMLPDLVITITDFEKGQLAEDGRQPPE